ncbi:MAG: H-type lectin domain-containing protein [Melioribacteraceae bacterium]|nr:H-type lectin domain-containing protein [Melioribacteraceae bacterium]MCF8264697.1 H-type lectin domain-containing protein [Melioribacteraceae bacterium]MCF8412237.1 H-type lectin domain-containing protein [Melioribacteraceae bacterium]MCF8431119.1 H-type lectin domain-containing protein [Melioribacteraceae bacterium]
MKKIVLSLFVLLYAFTFASAQEIQSGNFTFNSKSAGFNLNGGSGERFFTFDIKFEEEFGDIPKVIVGVTEIDADKNTNLRYKLEPISITSEGFTLKVKTWADTKIFLLGGFWLAHEID